MFQVEKIFIVCFCNNSVFNQDINLWDVSSAENTSYMFYGSSDFNQNLSDWNVSQVKSMDGMFGDATNFNGNISNWNVSNVETMADMFYRSSKFNKNISGWDVSSVTNMDRIFNSASVFNQNLSDWDVCDVTSYTDFDSLAGTWAASSKPKLGYPCIVGVNSSSFGTYYLDETINIQIEFNRDVLVTGTPKLELLFDSSKGNASYVGGSGF